MTHDTIGVSMSHMEPTADLIAATRPHYNGTCDCDGDCVADRFTFAEAIGYTPPTPSINDCWDRLAAAGLTADNDL